VALAVTYASDTSYDNYIAALALARTELDGLGGGGLAWEAYDPETPGR